MNSDVQIVLDHIENKAILRPFIEDGRVDYVKLQEANLVNLLLENLHAIDLEELDSDERLAYWLNTYNLLVLQTVLRKLEEQPNWEGVTSLWRKFKFFVWNKYHIGGKKISLYNLENKILRKEFDDPRIHFALNCASTSCPFLPEKIFTKDNLNQYLEKLTIDFINEQAGVIVEDNTVFVSKIFEMYKPDFGGESGIVQFVRKYYEGHDFPSNPELRYQNYNWRLNRK